MGFWEGFGCGILVVIAAFVIVAADQYRRIPDSPMQFKKRVKLRVVDGGRR